MMAVYKTKASLLIKSLFAILLVIVLTVALMEKNLALMAVTLVFSGLVIYIFYTTQYTIDQNKLTVKSGFLFSETIDINTIRKITRKRRNLLSGPGFSADRLIIEYGDHGCIIISPNKKGAFVRHLVTINPEIISTL